MTIRKSKRDFNSCKTFQYLLTTPFNLFNDLKLLMFMQTHLAPSPPFRITRNTSFYLPPNSKLLAVDVVGVAAATAAAAAVVVLLLLLLLLLLLFYTP